MKNVDISGLDKAAVLVALFNASQQQGMGFMDRRGAVPLTEANAKDVISEDCLRFDYLFGRVLKVDLSGDTFDPWGFDRDNGPGAAERAIASLRSLNAGELEGAAR